MSFSIVGSAIGDVLHLKSGGAVEGSIVEQTGSSYTVRTVVGTITVPIDTVTRIEKKPSILDEYDRRLTRVADTSKSQLGLAKWCDENGYSAGARKHYKRAVELDPDCEEARKALGFTRVGGAWVKGGPTADGAASRPSDGGNADRRAARDDDQIVAAIQSHWMVRIRGIRQNKLESTSARLVADGQRKIAEITDPLAILPLIRVLSRGNLACRDALVAALTRFPQDEATANLAALALTDRDAQIRRNCLSELRRRNDSRVIPQFRRALFSDNDPLIRRAASGLGALRARAAIPDLIDSLTVRRNKRVEVSVRAYLYDMQSTFNGPIITNYGGGRGIQHYAIIGVPAIGANFLFEDSVIQRRNVTVFRTEVLEALRTITGQNFGFDAADWRRWYEEQRP